jgi:hypothetical protein
MLSPCLNWSQKKSGLASFTAAHQPSVSNHAL